MVTVEWTIGKGSDGWKGKLLITDFKWDSQIDSAKQRKIADIYIPEKLELYTGPSVRHSSEAAASSSFSAATTSGSMGPCSSGSYNQDLPPIRRRSSADTPRTAFESRDRITPDRDPLNIHKNKKTPKSYFF